MILKILKKHYYRRKQINIFIDYALHTPDLAKAIKAPTKVNIIFGFTSTISSGKTKIVAPNLRAMEIAYFAFNLASSSVNKNYYIYRNFLLPLWPEVTKS